MQKLLKNESLVNLPIYNISLIEKICLSFSQARSAVVLGDHADRGPCLQGPACADPGEVAGPVAGDFAQRV